MLQASVKLEWWTMDFLLNKMENSVASNKWSCFYLCASKVSTGIDNMVR